MNIKVSLSISVQLLLDAENFCHFYQKSINTTFWKYYLTIVICTIIQLNYKSLTPIVPSGHKYGQSTSFHDTGLKIFKKNTWLAINHTVLIATSPKKQYHHSCPSNNPILGAGGQYQLSSSSSFMIIIISPEIDVWKTVRMLCTSKMLCA